MDRGLRPFSGHRTGIVVLMSDSLTELPSTSWERRKVEAMSRIQQVALDLFDAHGYRNVTIERVAAAAEVSPSSIYRYFGTNDFDKITPAVFDAGRDRLTFDFADEKDPGRRFALWTLLHALGDAPDPAATFKDPRLREAAQRYALLAARIDEN